MGIKEILKSWFYTPAISGLNERELERLKEKLAEAPKITVTHKNGTLSFFEVSVIYNRWDISRGNHYNLFNDLNKEIIMLGGRLPTGDEVAFLCSEPSSYLLNNFRKQLFYGGIKVFNKNFWTDKGVYVVQDTEPKVRIKKPIVNNLENMLEGGEEIEGVKFSKDGNVRFAGYRGEYQKYKAMDKKVYLCHHFGTNLPLSKNSFAIASFGEKGAKKIEDFLTTIGFNYRIITPPFRYLRSNRKLFNNGITGTSINIDILSFKFYPELHQHRKKVERCSSNIGDFERMLLIPTEYLSYTLNPHQDTSCQHYPRIYKKDFILNGDSTDITSLLQPHCEPVFGFWYSYYDHDWISDSYYYGIL